MKKNRLGNTDLYVSEVGMGVLTIGGSQLNLGLEEGAEIIRYALSKGINFFDTAQYYETYHFLKEALKDVEEKPVICSKCLGWTYEEMEYAIDEALRELDLESIDIFLMHEVRPIENRRNAWQALLDAKASGKVKYIGISTHHVDVVEDYLQKDDIDVIFPLINFDGLGIRKGDGFGTSQEMAAAIKKASEKGIGIFAMKVFGGGHLTKDYTKALDYVYNLPGIDSMMIGFGKTSHVDQAVAYVDGQLPDGFEADTLNKKTYIEPGNCEGCGACIARCPNDALYFNENGTASVNHSLCLTCGYCAPVCPVRAIILLDTV